jgi:hypothetical protein
VSDSKRLLADKSADARKKNAELRAALKDIAEDEATERRGRTGYVNHARADRYRYLISKAKTLCNAGVAKDRLRSELLAQYTLDYGDIRDDDPNGWPLAELNKKVQSKEMPPQSAPCSTVSFIMGMCSSVAREVGEPNWTRQNNRA